MSKVVIAGCGAAGMYAAITAAQAGHQVLVCEKNEKPGKKLYITGKGRCNVTNDCDPEEFLKNVCTNRKFLYSAIYGCTSQDVMDFFESHGLKLKTERGNRVFPASDHSSDVIAALRKTMQSFGIETRFRAPVKRILAEDGRAAGVVLENGEKISADAVIVATGGLAYPSTGSTGDGYRFAKETGHTVTEQYPALVPMNIKEDIPGKLQGLSLKNVQVSVMDGKKRIYEDFGEMMFTHFGVTGPLILSASSAVGAKQRGKELTLSIYLKPALSEEQLDARILRDFDNEKNKQFKNALGGLFPSKLIPVMIEVSGIDPEKKVHEISREERRNFSNKIKNFRLTITGFRDYNESIITRGGVSVKEVNPSTMESRILPGLFFAGEVLDLDALTGGFNLQIAWATGRAAGLGI